MGAVYAVHDTASQRDLALKRLSSDASAATAQLFCAGSGSLTFQRDDASSVCPPASKAASPAWSDSAVTACTVRPSPVIAGPDASLNLV